jgi:misacylated tRNA(Ala) deacylase
VIELLFRDDVYLGSCEATLIDVRSDGGLVFDRTVFYATSGGQPGDTGSIRRANGDDIRIVSTVAGETKEDIVHIPAEGSSSLTIGEKLTLSIDWQRRLNLMRMHTACHILSVVCPFPITGAAVGEEESRVDFDLPDSSYTREFVTAEMQKVVDATHPVTLRWIDESELDSNPSIVKSKNVRPPRGLGRIRLVLIGENGLIDSQPCGGTHVANTSEIGLIHISKIEKKGRENRRFRIQFGPMPDTV